MGKFAGNLRHLRSLKKKSQEQLAEDLKLTRSRISSYEEGRSEPPIDILIALSDYFEIPVDVLLRNDLSKSDGKTFIKVAQHRILFPIVVNQQDKDLIEVITEKASAGYTRGYSDPDYIASLPLMQLPFVPIGKHRAFPIAGDSMEPLVRSGSYVVGRFVEQVKELRQGQTYVLICNDGMVYKRLDLSAIKEGKLLLISDNPFYKPYYISVEDVLEFWEFTCHINLSNYKPEELNLNSIMAMMRDLQIELKDLRLEIQQKNIE
ncbi:MAG: LexA family transcriptional regulator [Cytophagaceae bacterium]|jgi:transcriptional regulator with XRE-family HTH domain|nr:LexA family transcriptional regulator [Cytophagaceae bacterium]